MYNCYNFQSNKPSLSILGHDHHGTISQSQSNQTKCDNSMRETTKRRYRKIRKRFNELLGTGKLMCIYLQLAEEFDLSDERIRQIVAMNIR